MTTVGYIGLGAMGSAMTEWLLSNDRSMVVFDLDDAAMHKAVEQGATALGSAAEVAAQADVLSICVPAAEHIDAVFNGEQGIAEGAHPGLTVLIHSTVHPDTIASAQQAAAPGSVQVFDACVAGGAEAAKTGELAMFVGGWDDMSPQVRSVVESYGSKVIDGGPVGSGAALKIGVNVMTYMQQAAGRISFALMDNVGAETQSLVEAWRHIGQLGTLTEQYLGLLGIPDEHITGAFQESLAGAASLGVKDLGLARELGSVTPELDAVLDALIASMPQVMRATNDE